MRPIDDMLRAQSGRVRFHMPGHKGRLEGIDPALDTTELPDTDDLYAPSAGIAEAEGLLAASCGAAASVLLPGGATSGILAMVLSHVRPGGRLLMPRDAHRSALSACILAGAEPVLIPPDADVARAARDVRPDAVLIARPDYYGRVRDLPDIPVPVLVDAAHGAHFNWWHSPAGAMRAGATAAVESAHKTLGALTGGAWMHFRGARAAESARRMLRLVSTSSPSFLILRSIDDARARMDEDGAAALARTAALCERLRAEIGAMPGLSAPNLGDPTRLYIRTDDLGLSGWSACEQLRARGVDLEMADARGVVAIATIFDRLGDFARLAAALRDLRGGDFAPGDLPPPAYGEPAAPARAAALARAHRAPLRDAVGEISAAPVGIYPPGCAVVAPGERFTAAAVDYLLRMELLGAHIFGAEGGCVAAADKEDALHGQC